MIAAAAAMAVASVPALTQTTTAAAPTWQSYQKVMANAYEGAGTGASLVIELPGHFSSCDAYSTGQISLSVVGADQYHVLTEVVLMAVSEGLSVSVETNGCVNGRANVIGLKLGE
jgi:hypothetical protein